MLPVLLVLACAAGLSAVSALEQGNAQKAADSLTFFLAAPGNCMEVNSDLPVNAPSKNLAALWIRAAFHDMATLDLSNVSFPGGPDATLVYTTNITENMGLQDTIADRFVPDKSLASKADLIALGGVISVKHCGGPDISFRGGRRDVAPEAVILGNSQRIPGGNEAYPSVKAKMIRMGFSPVDIALLITGSHTMGGVHGAISPTITKEKFVPFDDTPGVFDNDVFKQTLAGKCAIPVDCAIAQDPELRPFIELFARDQNEFFRQYSLSFQKMLELTAAPLDATSYTLNVAVHAHLLDEGYYPGRKPNGTVTGSVSPSATSKTNSANLYGRYTASLALASALAGLLFLWS